MRFSVIMASYLESYEVNGIKSASLPEKKFVRAINSFIDQSFKDAELIIISDGCNKTVELYNQHFKNKDNITCGIINKQIPFSGKVRQAGLSVASGEIICYLDHDDRLGKDHLKIINDNFADYDWVYYNDYLIHGFEEGNPVFTEREVAPELYYIGTSMIAHKRNLNVIWPDGYTHDWKMINNCLLHHKSGKIPTSQYYVCHFHSLDD